MSIDIETLVQAIRFDIDYHCIEKRKTVPLQGSINRELHNRLKLTISRGRPMYPQHLRMRVLNSLCESASEENHKQFDEALEIFRDRLSEFDENKNADYSGSEVVIDG